MVKQLRQVAGVRQVKVVDFKKGIFALTPKQGVRLSQTAIAAAVKRSGFSLSKIVPPNGKPSKGSAVPATPPDSIDKLLATARKTFRNGDVNRAANMAIAIVGDLRPVEPGKHSPRDADALQFVALVSFSQKKYDAAAKYAHLALHRGSHWNWKTLSGHYRKPSDYVSQLRTLEASIRDKPTAGKRFLVGYHYLMLGYGEAARKQLELAAKEQPKNAVIQSLLHNLKKGPKR
ncbi:MAG: tetratricopeptide repeat protein [Planctomycetaceae bacterium]